MPHTETYASLKTELKSRLRIEDLVRRSGVDLKREGRQLVGCCPFHNENTPSFKIAVEEQFFKCFGCGASGDALAWIAHTKFKTLDPKGEQFIEVLREACTEAGIDFPERTPKASPGAIPRPAPSRNEKTVFPSREKLREAVHFLATGKNGRVAGEYAYTDPVTRAEELIVFRVEHDGGKTFIQATTTPSGGFAFGGRSRNPIYNRARVLKADAVVVVEGEKKVHCLHELGLTATCSPGGANSAIKADWSPLAGKTVCVWPDNDEPGKKYAADVAAQLRSLSPRPFVSIVNTESLNLAAKEDVVDFVQKLPQENSSRYDAVVQVIANARAIGPLAELAEQLKEAVDGSRYPIPLAWSMLNSATHALLPGCVTIFCGGPGGTKSLGLLQNLRSWQAQGVRVVANMLEDGTAYHLRRALAQIVNDSNVTNDAWCRDHADELAAYSRSAERQLRDLEQCIESPKDSDELTVDALLEWIRAKADEGHRVICIDPITMMQRGSHPWQDDERFLIGAKKIIERYRASLLLVSHPRKVPQNKSKDFEMSDLAGGACFERFAQAIVYLKAHEEKSITVATTVGRVAVSANRTICVLKARNSYGAGSRLALKFDSKSLTLTELGMIVSEAPRD